MHPINGFKIDSKFGVPNPNEVKWNRNYTQDMLVISEINDLGVVLEPANFRPRTVLMFSLDPRLLAMGATFTSIVEGGEIPLVFVPCSAEDLPENPVIRGYLP